MKSKLSYNHSEVDTIIAHIQEKLKADPVKQKTIRAKIRHCGFYGSDYGFRNGYSVKDFLSVAKIDDVKASPNGKIPFVKPITLKSIKPLGTKSNNRKNSDECYIINLCDEVLLLKAYRQHRFYFLRGDTGSKLPVDAWYPQLSLVIEYREKQHTEEVSFFDKKQTVSGISRGDQRKLYDQRRRDILPRHGIKLIELGYDDFEHTASKKLVRNRATDFKKISEVLKKL